VLAEDCLLPKLIERLL